MTQLTFEWFYFLGTVLIKLLHHLDSQDFLFSLVSKALVAIFIVIIHFVTEELGQNVKSNRFKDIAYDFSSFIWFIELPLSN